jgi:hypothetical protein
MSLLAFGSILKKFFLWEPTSVDVRVVLLAEDDTMGEYLHFCTELETFRIYMRMYMVDKSTKRWILTSLKIDEPFGPRFHFEKLFFFFFFFLGTNVSWCESHTRGRRQHNG